MRADGGSTFDGHVEKWALPLGIEIRFKDADAARELGSWASRDFLICSSGIKVWTQSLILWWRYW
ncbi:hypothetical protein SPHINGOR109_70073 [Sphingorhabdus sp. 109]|nr:hypothetical protein SPHINGOR109_70073 [Sphingorhabdus sp. 109]